MVALQVSLLQNAMLIAGIVTLVQVFSIGPVGGKLPIVMGTKMCIRDRYLGEGGLDNPPTPIFQPQIGEATLVSLVPIKGEYFRLVVSKGEILEKWDMPNNEMPYLFYRPDCGIRYCVEEWMKKGGTHHEVITLDVYKRQMEYRPKNI